MIKNQKKFRVSHRKTEPVFGLRNPEGDNNLPGRL